MPTLHKNALWGSFALVVSLCFLLPPPCNSQSTSTMKLLEVSNSSSLAYLREGKQFSPSEGNPTARGDRIVFYDDVFDYSSGTRGDKVGTCGGSGGFIDPSGQVFYYTQTYQFLTGDSLSYAGYNNISGVVASPIACIGGTGKYRGAKGELASTQNCNGTDCEYTLTATVVV